MKKVKKQPSSDSFDAFFNGLVLGKPFEWNGMRIEFVDCKPKRVAGVRKAIKKRYKV